MEDVLIPVVVFSSLLLFLKMMLDFARFRHEHKAGTQSRSGTASNSLRVSELEALVQDAVDDAVRPLERRIRRLERSARRDNDSLGGPVDEQERRATQDSRRDSPRRMLSERPVDGILDDDYERFGESGVERDLDLDAEFGKDDRRVRQPRVRRS